MSNVALSLRSSGKQSLLANLPANLPAPLGH